LRNNQVSAIDVIIDHIIKYQNNFVSSFLFQKNFSKLLEKGVKLARVLRSDIFSFQFDYDEWPSNHVDDKTYYRAYNDSIFELRNNYAIVFPEEDLQDIETRQQEVQSDKVYKIKYSLNTLSRLGECVDSIDPLTGEKTFLNKGYSILDEMCSNNELELFETQQVIDLITFKWQKYAKKLHLTGCIAHFTYVTILMIYIYHVYIQNDQKDSRFYGRLLFIGVLYPMTYDLTQLYRSGFRQYFSEL
jgi:hypothetical protein